MLFFDPLSWGIGVQNCPLRCGRCSLPALIRTGVLGDDGRGNGCADSARALRQGQDDPGAEELRAVGPEYEHRRAAAVVGLIETGNIQMFANLKDHEGKPEDISIGLRSSLDESDRYYNAAPAPIIAFDVTAGAYRLAAHVLHALLT